MRKRTKLFLFVILVISMIFVGELLLKKSNIQFIPTIPSKNSLNAKDYTKKRTGEDILSSNIANKSDDGSFNSESFSRKDLQNMIVSTAMSYYFNRNYTDYEQYGMDIASTYEWRKYTNSPEMVSKSNFYNVTCSTFTGIVDLYSIGYDLSPYYKFSNISYRNYDDSGKLIESHSKDSYLNFQTAYLNYGKGVNASDTGMLVNRIFDVYDLIPECTEGNCNNIQYNLNNSYTKKVDNKTIGQYASDLVYYYETKLNDSNVINAARTSLLNSTREMSISASSVDYTENESEISQIRNDVINILEPGDNLVYLRLSGTTIKAHAMKYVGDIFGDEHGFIHSTGSDLKYANDDSNGHVVNPSSIGDDNYGIWYDTWENKIQHNKISDYIFRDGAQKTYAFFIIRPINRYCSKQDNHEKCYIGYGNQSEYENTIISNKYKENAATYLTNSLFREKLKYLRTDQFQYFIRDGETKISEYLNKYNSVNLDDIITYRLELTNKSNLYGKSIDYGDSDGNITITAKVPDGTEYISCFEGPAESCSYNNGEIVWNNVVIPASNQPLRITYKVKVKTNKLIENDGMKIIYSYECDDGTNMCNNYLQLGRMTTNVNYTINDSDNIDKFQKAVDDIITENKQYLNDSGKVGNAFDFISDIYSNVFDIDLGSDFTSKNIRETVFKVLPTNIEDEIKDIENDATSITNSNTFVKRLLIKDEQKNIDKMLVPGAYGGRNLNYDVEGNRATILLKKDIKSTLEVGDVVITWDLSKTANSIRVYPYLFYGYNSEDYPVFVLFHNGNYTKYGSDDDSGYKLFKKIYAYDLFAILRPTRIYDTDTNVAAININKDNNPWLDLSNEEIKVKLVKDNLEYTDYVIDNNVITFRNLSNGTYNIYASYNSSDNGKNNFVDSGLSINVNAEENNAATLDYYSLIRKEGNNTILNTKYNSKEGAAFTSSSLYFLKNQKIYVEASASDGYQLQLTINKEDKSSPYIHTITMPCSIETKSSANTYIITLDNQQATTVGTTEIYEVYNTNYYLDSNKTNVMSLTTNGITIPFKTGFTFDGYYDGNIQMIDSEGYITSNLKNNAYKSDVTLYARWSEGNPYVINEYTYDEDNQYVSNIDVHTDVDVYKQNIELLDGYTVNVDSKVVDNKQVVYTGGKTKIYKNQTLYAELTNIVSGDTNGDGKINYLDYVNVYNHIQKTKHPESQKKLLVDEYLLAADMSNDNKISYLDYVRIYNKIKELKGGTN